MIIQGNRVWLHFFAIILFVGCELCPCIDCLIVLDARIQGGRASKYLFFHSHLSSS